MYIKNLISAGFLFCSLNADTCPSIEEKDSHRMNDQKDRSEKKEGTRESDSDRMNEQSKRKDTCCDQGNDRDRGSR